VKKREQPDAQVLAKARDEFGEITETIRLMGMDEETIEHILAGLCKLYDPSRGEFNLDDQRAFLSAVMPAMMHSGTMEKVIESTHLLERPELRKLWFNERQMQQTLDEYEVFLADFEKRRGPEASAELFHSKRYARERKKMGRMLWKCFRAVVSPELGRTVYSTVFSLYQSAQQPQEKELARHAMSCFTLFPTLDNPFLQFLFVKSLLEVAGIAEDIRGMAASDEEADAVRDAIEGNIFAALTNAVPYEELMEGDEAP